MADEVGASVREVAIIPGGYSCPWYYVRGTPVVTVDHPLYVDDVQGCMVLEEDALRIRIVVEAPNDALVECLQGRQALAPLCPREGWDGSAWSTEIGLHPKKYRLLNSAIPPPSGTGGGRCGKLLRKGNQKKHGGYRERQLPMCQGWTALWA